MSNQKNQSNENNHEGVEPIMLTSRQAAIFLSCALPTITNARYTGLLCGVAAPAYIKRGKSIFYKRETLEKWNGQFEEQASTSQNVA